MCGMIYPTFHIKQTLWYKKRKNKQQTCTTTFFSHTTQHVIPADSKEE